MVAQPSGCRGRAPADGNSPPRRFQLGVAVDEEGPSAADGRFSPPVAVVGLGARQRLRVGGYARWERTRLYLEEKQQQLGFQLWGAGRLVPAVLVGSPARDGDCGCGCGMLYEQRLGAESDTRSVGRDPAIALLPTLGQPQRAEPGDWVRQAAHSRPIPLGVSGPGHALFGRSNTAAVLPLIMGAGGLHGPVVQGATIGAWLGSSGNSDPSPRSAQAVTPSCLFMVAEDHWCHEASDEDLGDISLEAADIDLINDAYWKLNHYIAFIEDFYLDHASAWDFLAIGPCALQRIVGAPYAGPVTIDENTSSDYMMVTAPSLPVVTIETVFMNAVLKFRDDTSNDARFGDWNCPTAEFAALLLHEIHHSCGAWSGLLPQLTQAFFQFCYRNFWDFTEVTCCQTKPFPSWDQVDVTCETLLEHHNYMGDDPDSDEGIACGRAQSCK